MADRPLQVVVTWNDPTDHAAGVGLQDKAGELVEGEPGADGSLRYEIDVSVRARSSSGTEFLDFVGPFVHGPVGERFLYLSFRAADSDRWERRSKIMLPESAPAYGQSISATILEANKSRAVLDSTGWRIEE